MALNNIKLAHRGDNMGRKRIDVGNKIKVNLKEIREIMGFKTDSETVAYLIALFYEFYDQITLPQDRHFRDQAFAWSDEKTSRR